MIIHVYPLESSKMGKMATMMMILQVGEEGE